jgi:predicted acyltransferase
MWMIEIIALIAAVTLTRASGAMVRGPEHAAPLRLLGWIVCAAGMWLLDVRGIRRPFAPLVDVGTNPIVIYVGFMASLALLRNYGEALVPDLAPLGSPTSGFMVYAVIWTVLWWLCATVLYRRRIFIKI